MAAGPAKAGLPAAVAKWSLFIAHAKLRRLDPDRFAALLRILYSRRPLPPILIADLLLRPTKNDGHDIDIRVLAYLQVLMKQGRLGTAVVLRALYKYTSAHARAQPASQPQQSQSQPQPGGSGSGSGSGGSKEQDGAVKGGGGCAYARWRNSYASEEIILWRLAQAVNKGTGIRTSGEVIRVAKVIAKWMALLTEAAAAFSRDAFGSMAGLQMKDETECVRNALILFLYAFSESPVVVSTLSRPACKGICKMLLESLEGFLPFVMQLSPEIAGPLERFRTQTLAVAVPSDKKDAAVSGMNTYMDNILGLDSFQVPEMPISNTRAGLYIYLNAALVGRPMIDDEALFTYLHNRYQGDIQSTATQLILASFDLLANAVFRNDGPKTGHLLKSYLVNKVPLLLVSLASSSAMYPFNPELCITQALGQVDTNVFPTLSGMFDMSNTGSSPNDSVRQDFSFACQLHGLLSQGAIENLLGDITYQSLPDEGRYVKELLVQSCLQDVDRTQKLIAELENMNGNVGAAAQAIVEVIGSLCRDKETMTLKQLCSQLAGKPLSLDVLLLFDKPQRILHPLCELLDNWAGYEEDQGEYQPVYEEFGSILLLLLAFVYRYSLSPADLGIRSPDSFVAKLLNGGDLWRPLEELNEREKSHLNNWITELFGSEAGGLGDDLMSSCPPQEFYLLVPAAFHQVVIALSAGQLTDDMLKNGLEYLVDVMLLPSLVPAILYLSDQLWSGGHQVQTAIIKILQAILKPSSISNEASAMLSSVLNIVAKPLDHALRSYQRQDPKCQEVEPLLRTIKENLALSRRTGGADHNELESWSSTHATNPATGGVSHSGLSAAVRNTVQALVQWAQNPPINGMPATYTHRQTLAALKVLGARRLLTILVEELRALGDTPQASVAYDVVVAIICAPDVMNDTSLSAIPISNTTGTAGAAAAAATAATTAPQQRRLPLRDALKAEADDWKALQKSDPVLAETVVRLSRRVEAQMALPPPQAAVVLQPELSALGVGVGGDVALGDAMAAVGGEHHGMEGMGLDGTGLDGGGGPGGGVPDLGDLTSQVSGGGAGGTGGLDLAGDDIFGGLGGAGEFGGEFGGWEMELG